MAAISAGETEVGELIGEAFAEAGNDAVVRVEHRDLPGVELEFVEGHAAARRRGLAPLPRRRLPTLLVNWAKELV